MFARFDENPAMTLRVIKETKRYGRTDAQTDGRTHGQRENSIPPTKFAGGIMIDLTSNLGEINDIEHKGSKIYPQNQAILDCIMPTIPPKYKCLSIILIWVIFSHK